ncbi:MAG: AAA family ATPase [Planctomycetota bacterium]|nr:AAA family ATPase [Planctomycetota bacterium]
MKIRSLAIRRMPGFENAGFDLTGLSEGLNLIIGPNASGKTTTCHAIRGLLWPEELAGLSPVSLASEWVDGPTAWRLEVEGDKTACQRDGVPADRPPLPPPNLARCFTITVDNLFEDTQTDEALAGNVAREMAGGYDLGALRSAAWMKLSAKHGRKERDELRDRTRAAEGIRARQQELLRQEQELAGLEEQARQSREAQWQLSLVRTAIELLELRRPSPRSRTTWTNRPGPRRRPGRPWKTPPASAARPPCRRRASPSPGSTSSRATWRPFATFRKTFAGSTPNSPTPTRK